MLLILYSQVYNGWRGFLSWEIITILGWHRMNRYATWLGDRLCFLRGTVQPPIWQVGHYQLKLIVSGVIRVCSKPHFQWPVKGTCSSHLGGRTCPMTGDLILYISLLRQHLAAKMHISILDLSCQLFLTADGWYFLLLIALHTLIYQHGHVHFQRSDDRCLPLKVGGCTWTNRELRETKGLRAPWWDI